VNGTGQRRVKKTNPLGSFCGKLFFSTADTGLTQEQLAKMINTKKTAISRIENHAQHIKISTLQKVAKGLGKNLGITLN
jgi:DNA-binding XRE family transcriptional regulator